MANEIVTHPFQSKDGRRCRVVDAGEVSDPHLEINGRAVEPCYITGPEILKLAEQGRALWSALNRLVVAVDRSESLIDPMADAFSMLTKTAPTFDHNEAEAPRALPQDEDGEEPSFADLIQVFSKPLPEPELERDAPIPLVPEAVAAAQRGECVTEQEHLASLDEADVYPEVERG